MPNQYTAKIQITAQDKASGSIDKLSNKFDPLNRKARKFDKNMSKADKSIKKSSKSMNKLKSAMGLAAVAGSAFAAVKLVGNKINDMDELAKAARAAGAATSNEGFKGFQVLKQAMSEAGIEAATYERALLQTTTRLKAGTEGQKSYKAVTDKLGDSIRTSNGELKTGPDLLIAMTNALNEGRITTEDFAKVVGGRAGPLIQQQFASINKTAEDLQKTLDDTAQHTDIISLRDAKMAELFNDNISRLKNSFGKLMTKAIQPLLPVLNKLIEGALRVMPPIVEKIGSAFSAIGEVLGPLVKVLFPLIWKSLWPVRLAFKAFGFYIKNIIFPIFKVLITIVTKVAETISGFVDGIIKAFNAIKTFGGKIAKFFGFGEGDEIEVTGNKNVNQTLDVVDKMKEKTSSTNTFNKNGKKGLVTSSLAVPTNLTVNVNRLNVDGADPVGSQKALEQLIKGVASQTAVDVIIQNQKFGGLYA
jgi:hypothetical protein